MKKNELFLILILAAIQFTHILDIMIIMPLGKQFMEVFNISPSEFAFIVSIYAYSAAATGILSAFYLDKFDRRKALIFTYIGFTIGTFLCAIAPEYWSFMGARIVSGGFGGVMTTLVLSIIGDVFSYEKRGRATGYVMMAFSVSSIVGVPIGIWIAAKYDWRMTFYAVGALALVCLVLIYFKVPSIKNHLNQENQQNAWKNIQLIFKTKNQRNALIFSLCLIFGHFVIIPFIAPYMQFNIGFSDEQVTYLYFIGGLCSVVALPLIGNLADKFGKKQVFTIGTFLAIGSIFWITNLVTTSIVLALFATSSYFVASGSRTVPATAIVTSVIQPESRGSFMSIRTVVNQLAIGLSSQIAGFIIVKNADGTLGNYEYTGYFAIFMSLVALAMVVRLKIVS